MLIYCLKEVPGSGGSSTCIYCSIRFTLLLSSSQNGYLLQSYCLMQIGVGHLLLGPKQSVLHGGSTCKDIQPLCHLALKAPHGSKNLAVGEQWPLPCCQVFGPLGSPLGQIAWRCMLDQVHRTQFPHVGLDTVA